MKNLNLVLRWCTNEIHYITPNRKGFFRATPIEIFFLFILIYSLKTREFSLELILIRKISKMITMLGVI